MPSWSSWNRHYSVRSSTRAHTHLLSYLWSRVGREPLCLDLCLLFDLSSTWRGVSKFTRFPPFGPKSGQTLDECYTSTPTVPRSMQMRPGTDDQHSEGVDQTPRYAQ